MVKGWTQREIKRGRSLLADVRDQATVAGNLVGEAGSRISYTC